MTHFDWLTIARYEEDWVYLFHCDSDWNVVTDTYHDSLERAIEQAEFEFGAIESETPNG